VPAGAPQFYAVVPSAAAVARALPVIERLREAGNSVLMHAGPGNLKSQLQKADASGAKYALIFSDEDQFFKVKHLRDRDAPQKEFPLHGEADLLPRLREELRL
jgi:histidyl-tRNA synthetase